MAHYLEYLTRFVNGESSASRDSDDVIKKEGINPVSYLLRKLKLDLKMSYERYSNMLHDNNELLVPLVLYLPLA